MATRMDNILLILIIDKKKKQNKTKPKIPQNKIKTNPKTKKIKFCYAACTHFVLLPMQSWMFYFVNIPSVGLS